MTLQFKAYTLKEVIEMCISACKHMFIKALFIITKNCKQFKVHLQNIQNNCRINLCHMMDYYYATTKAKIKCIQDDSIYIKSKMDKTKLYYLGM